MKIGSLCSGYGGLDMAVEAFYNAETVWMSDIDKASNIVIEKRWGLPNLGDLKSINWDVVEQIDILTAGYPCQPFSTAGKRMGANDARHIWPSIKEIISTIRPKIVILENVKGHLTLGFKEVLQDLTEIGYDAKWTIVRASDVGAPHRRERLFIIAYPNSFNRGISSQDKRTIASDTDGNGCKTRLESGFEQTLTPTQSITTAASSNTINQYRSTDRKTQELGSRFKTPFDLSMLTPPNPLDQSKLNPKFVEYMMGLPNGWVTDLNLSRSQIFKLLGNGVVPQQAFQALKILNEN